MLIILIIRINNIMQKLKEFISDIKNIRTNKPKKLEIKKVENLVFSGGGVKVISYAGVLEVLEEQGYLKQIKKVAGASGGAIAALCISLGYNSQEIKAILINLDFNRFADKNHWWQFYKKALNLFGYGGMNSGKYIQEFVEKLLTDKRFDKTITFKQLHDHLKSSIDLYVVATNLDSQYPEVLSYETSPNTKIAAAVHASCAFPGYFLPEHIGQFVYADGGIMNNYPIKIFDDPDIARNRTTLGFKPIDPKIKSDYEQGKEPQSFTKTNSGVSILAAEATALISADMIVALENAYRTVFINDNDISALEFSISSTKKNALIQSGHTAMYDYLELSGDTLNSQVA